MCFGRSQEKKRPSSPHAQPVEMAAVIPVPRGIQWVEPLTHLGYYHCIEVEGTERRTPLYGIKHVRYQGVQHSDIAKLSACVEDGLL